MSNIGIPTLVFQDQPRNSEAREPTNEKYLVPDFKTSKLENHQKFCDNFKPLFLMLSHPKCENATKY